MTADANEPPAPPAAPDALFVLDLPDGLQGTPWEDGDLAKLTLCEKIVLGRPGEATPTGLPKGILSWPAGLTTLHLWGLLDLKSLPPFAACPQLETLDLSGCTALQSLPAIGQLEQLEWLDLAGCTALTRLPKKAPASLQFLYLADCTGLEHEELVRFLHALGAQASKPPRLVELDLSRTCLRDLPKFTWEKYWDEEGFAYDERTRMRSRRWIEKIVLRDCKELKSIGLPLEALPKPRHLDVAGCSLLAGLPALPLVRAYPAPVTDAVFQYLRVDGSGINEHRGSSIRARHRKEDEPETRRNAAEVFLAWQQLGEPVEMPECRLMVLGNSMAGKSMLVRRLLYGIPGEELPGYLEPYEGRDEWKPRAPLPSTHPVQLPTWPVKIEGFEKPAHVQIWDYGGQQKYHRSHRTFVKEGTIFVLVWRHPEANVAEHDHARQQELLREEDAEQSLEYWLDYIVSSGACAKEHLVDRVVIVCAQSKGHFDKNIDEKLRRSIGDNYVDYVGQPFVVEAYESTADDTASLKWKQLWVELRSRVKSAIVSQGCHVPDFVSKVSSHIIRARNECRTNPDSTRFREIAFPNEQQWNQQLSSLHDLSLTEASRRAVTHSLHLAGALYRLQPPGRPERRFVIVDQSTALDWIYVLLSGEDADRPSFVSRCRQNLGRFKHEDLTKGGHRGSEVQPLFDHDWQRDLALELMEDCRLVLRDRNSAEAEPRYIALEDVLLPEVTAREAGVHARRFRWRAQPAPKRFDILGRKGSPIGHGVFQDFRAFLLEALHRVLRSDCFQLYRGGLQVEVSETDWYGGHDEQSKLPQSFLAEFAWRALEPDGYGGVIEVSLDAKSEPEVVQLHEALFGDGGICRGDRSPLSVDVFPSRLEFSEAKGAQPFLLLDATSRDKYPFGVSCRGSNKDVDAIYQHLMSLDPPHFTFYYRGEEVLENYGDGHTEAVLGALGACHVLVLMMDDEYFETSEKTRYCLEELAMAIFRYDGIMNWKMMEHGQTVGNLELIKRRLGSLYRNAKESRTYAKDRTIIYCSGDPNGLSTKVRSAMDWLLGYYQDLCNGKEFENHPRLFFKRDLLDVLVNRGGMAKFNTELLESGATIADIDKLKQRLEQLAKDIPNA